MQISPNNNTDLALRISQLPSRVDAKTPPRTDHSQAEFSGSQNLNQALRMAPEVRPEILKKAAGQIQNIEWPPQATIQRIASLLAANATEK